MSRQPLSNALVPEQDKPKRRPYPKNRKSRGPWSPETRAKIAAGVKRYAEKNKEEYAERCKKAGKTIAHGYATGRIKPNKGTFKKGRKADPRQIEAARKMRGPKHWNWQGGSDPKECSRCGSIFTPHSPASTQKYCSRTCYWEDMRLDGSKKRKKYTPGFNDKLKDAIRDMYGRRCYECGAEERDLDRALHVHHIDLKKINHDPENLIPMCNSCHTKLHSTLRSRDRNGRLVAA